MRSTVVSDVNTRWNTKLVEDRSFSRITFHSVQFVYILKHYPFPLDVTNAGHSRSLGEPHQRNSDNSNDTRGESSMHVERLSSQDPYNEGKR